MSDEDVDLQSWGWTDLSTYSSSVALDSEKEQQIASLLQTGIMSRRGLRPDDSLLDLSLPQSGASFTVGRGGWRSTRSLRSRRSQQHSVSCSESLLASTPHKATGLSLHNSSLHSVASDASLLSSLLEESSLHESTLVNSLWGRDHDVDPQESTIIAEQSTILADRTLIEGRCDKHPVQTLGRVSCKDCELGSDRKGYGATCRSPCRSPPPSSPLRDPAPGPSDHGEPDTSTIYCRARSRRRTAQSGRCRVMNMKESTLNLKEPHPNGSLCRTAGEGLRWLGRRHITTSVRLTRFRLRLSLVLLPLLLLLFGLWWFSPAGLQSVLPALNITEWRTALSDIPALPSVPGVMSSQGQSAEGAVEESREVQPDVEPLYGRPPPAEAQTAEEEAPAAEEAERLVRLERSLAALWERVEAGGRRGEQRHGEVLRLYTELRQQRLASAQSTEEAVEPWLSGLLDHRLSKLRRCLDEERRQRDQIRQQDLLQQQSQMSRLDQLQLQLQTLAARTEEVQWRQEAATTVSPSPKTRQAAASAGVARQAHDALQAEVARLEAVLEDIQWEVEGLSGCQDGCQWHNRFQQTISAQVSTRVREEVRALIYGSQLTVEGGGDSETPPDSLLQWLSQQYVSGADLLEALASLELRILRNISLKPERLLSEEMVRETVLQGTEPAGATISLEDVQVIVKNALRLFSQDQTGLADYALESGGGSILSTRCSETYETKAALLSLFGVPLWYFSQSPRAVIQPEVHPGNCWAFRGSKGFLVIRLSMRILPTAFSLEHIPKALAPSGTLHSAPRDFSVYGLDDESQDRGKLLGIYTYDKDGEALQTYPVTEENPQTFQIIEVQILSNWGHQEYTCMYRFRVHGTPSDV